ncbi:hypothetical protein F4780DRAFT_483795 [Xylariomycetidae sp. FL0641]|nr:hypothetical protein F4780DRAFT_483795 [Xylariomycetidae sp. FL0641]
MARMVAHMMIVALPLQLVDGATVLVVNRADRASELAIRRYGNPSLTRIRHSCLRAMATGARHAVCRVVSCLERDASSQSCLRPEAFKRLVFNVDRYRGIPCSIHCLASSGGVLQNGKPLEPSMPELPLRAPCTSFLLLTQGSSNQATYVNGPKTDDHGIMCAPSCMVKLIALEQQSVW